MPITIPPGDVRWLLKLVVSDTDTRRWVLDGDSEVVVDGETYSPGSPVLAVEGFDDAGNRMASRRWTVVLSDPHQTWYKTTLANDWRNKRVDLSSQHGGATVVHRKTGYLLQRVPVAGEDGGFQLNLVFGGLVDRVTSTKKRFTNASSQKAVDSTDTSMDEAQTELDISWGGNL